ncbi:MULTISPECIES: glycine--tRNA ligase subunit beta [unclassified Lysobacter]|uniref:glycine--tRNA ligase subunit beta n=1 Tax=unclassified Lysobacter TaxID=2635362 RepID=UPI0006FBBCDB|nr:MULTISPECIES: glycine--tRNA ligase subunit beta [unclassified Lysobacter]KRA17147.1 glycine--tRNA ligase subunit beta [Lysobacter sp. Root604]KRD31386.1 glycine--tRNA ligase subunit beta [Lysobacter sp. Root916]KRD76829.1 glycine--tRNA ligase subunit beta [Lysobacter sp. Root983]
MSNATSLQPLLIELGTEELPVKALPGLAQAFFDGVIDGLAKRGIAFDRNGAKPLYTPRRLAVLLPGVAVEQPEQKSEVLGPYLNIALDADGQPTKALQGFAAKAGIDWTQLEKTSDNKGERFVHRAIKPGAQTRDLLQDVIRDALAAMPIPKPMRWGDHDYGFARPAHWLVVLLGKDVVEAEVLGVRSDRMSRGHRFMHDKPVWFSTATDYVESLRGAKVLVDPDERRERIVLEVQNAARVGGGSARIDDGILEEVNGLTEWPKAIACGFEAEFLAVPQEALIATMEANQKFFPVLDAGGKLSERFVGIANIESRDESEVRKGYERVIRPRFADAKFFFVEDMKQGLGSMNEGLKTVKYQDKLGTVADKVARVAALAEAVAEAAGVDPALARRAAELSKADLQSRLVNEFPELQGIAGRYYAAVENEPLELAAALDEAYMPRFAGDAIAPSKLGQVLAIAERLDTLAGGFAAGLKPTGNKDPFALRRNALALARTLIEGVLDLDLLRSLDSGHNGATEAIARNELLSKDDGKRSGAPKSDARSAAEQIAELQDFVYDRLRGYYADKGVPAQQFEAVSALRLGSLVDLDRRLKAIAEFAKLPEAEALAAANKRIRNILKKVEGELPTAIDPALFAENAERELAEAVDAAVADTDPLLAQRDYVAVLGRLARLRPQVDAFFDGVMVNVDDPAVRNNRLALLKRLSDRLGSVAAIEHLSI